MTSEELNEVLEINETHPLTSTENSSIWSKKKTRSLIIGGLLKNRVMTEVFLYIGLVDDVFNSYSNTIQLLSKPELNSFTLTDILENLMREIRDLKGVPPTPIKLDSIFNDEFLKRGLLSKNTYKPGEYRSNISICQNKYSIPRNISMNYLKEEVNAIKSACQSLKKFRDTNTGVNLPLIRQCRLGVRSHSLSFSPQGRVLWEYLKQNLFSRVDLVNNIDLYHQRMGDLVTFRNNIKSKRTYIIHTYNDIEFRIKELNRHNYPPKRINSYQNRVTIALEIQKDRRKTEDGEHLYQRLDTALRTIISVSKKYQYLRQVRSWLNIISDRLKRQEHKLNNHLRSFKSLRDVHEFRDRLNSLKDGFDALLVDEIEIPKFPVLNNQSQNDTMTYQFKDLILEEFLILTKWIGIFMEVFNEIQRLQRQLENVLTDLIEKGDIIL